MYSTRFQRQQEEIEQTFGDSEACGAQKEISGKAEKIFLPNLFRQSFLPMKELFFGKVCLYSYWCTLQVCVVWFGKASVVKSILHLVESIDVS